MGQWSGYYTVVAGVLLNTPGGEGLQLKGWFSSGEYGAFKSDGLNKWDLCISSGTSILSVSSPLSASPPNAVGGRLSLKNGNAAVMIASVQVFAKHPCSIIVLLLNLLTVGRNTLFAINHRPFQFGCRQVSQHLSNNSMFQDHDLKVQEESKPSI